MKEVGLTAPRTRFLGPDGLLEEELLKGATCDAALSTDMRITFAGLPFEKMRGVGAKTYEAYKAKFGKEPTAYALYAAEGARVIIDALRRAAPQLERAKDVTEKREAVRKAMASTKNFDGINGKRSFDENGDGDYDTVSGLPGGGAGRWRGPPEHAEGRGAPRLRRGVTSLPGGNGGPCRGPPFSYGVVGGSRPADDQRSHPWRRLRADRPRLHDGVRHHRADQLRPRRRLHARPLRVALLVHAARRDEDTDLLAAPDDPPARLLPHDALDRVPTRRDLPLCY